MSGRKKQIYVGFLLLGGAALFCDRVLFSAATLPESAAAGDSLPALQAVPSADDAAERISMPELPFPRSIGPAPEGEPVRDLFADPFSANSSDSRSPDNETQEESTRAADFAARHALQGIMIQQSVRVAVIDNSLLKVNDVLDGCTVSEILEREVRISCGKEVVSLSLPKPSGRPRP